MVRRMANEVKCNVMHLGYNNPSYQYSMNDIIYILLIDTEEEERDLGVTIHKSLKTILPYCTLCEKD